jgi:hypothetical protein
MRHAKTFLFSLPGFDARGLGDNRFNLYYTVRTV